MAALFSIAAVEPTHESLAWHYALADVITEEGKHKTAVPSQNAISQGNQ
jgi:hypothetical protein